MTETFDAHARLNPAYFTPTRRAPFLRNIERGLSGRGGIGYHVAWAGNRRAGYVALIPGGRVVIVQDIFADPSFRRQGMASRLLGHAAGVARERGSRLLHATVWDGNHASSALFEANGFSPRAPLLPQRIARLFPPLRSVDWVRSLD